MSDNRGTISAGVFSAADIKRRMTEREAQRAAEELRRLQAQEERQKAVMAEFQKPPDRTPEQLMQMVIQLVNRAAERGETEVQVYRFPNAMCSDRGAASTMPNLIGRRPWGAFPRPDTNSGATTCSRSASASKPKFSNIPAACPEMSASLSHGNRRCPSGK